MRTPNSTLTLREIAAKANVSVATVSYALSGKGRMAPETRRNIEGLLRKAGVRPRFKRYPVFYLSDHRAFSDMHAFIPFLHLYDGLNACFHDAEVDLRPEFLHLPSSGSLSAQLERLAGYRPMAVVLDSNLKQDLGAAGQFFESRHIPAIQVGHTVWADGIDAVVVDNFGGAHAAVTSLIASGHRRIGLIRWNTKDDPASSKKLAAYQCALTEAAIPIRPEYIVESPFSREGDKLPGRVAVEQLLKLPKPPTAVLVENSFISPSLLYPQNAEEREIPKAIRELDLIHFEAWHLDWVDQVMSGKLCFPNRRAKLIRIDWEDMGRVAAKRLLARIEGVESGGHVMQLVPSLVTLDGQTSTPFRAARH